MSWAASVSGRNREWDLGVRPTRETVTYCCSFHRQERKISRNEDG